MGVPVALRVPPTRPRTDLLALPVFCPDLGACPVVSDTWSPRRALLASLRQPVCWKPFCMVGNYILYGSNHPDLVLVMTQINQ